MASGDSSNLIAPEDEPTTSCERQTSEVDSCNESSTVIGDTSGCPPVAPIKYEYLDHTADVQLHTWGSDLKEAFEQCAISMFGYMTDIETVSVEYTFDIEAEGDDVEGLLFHFLDEWLFAFSAEPFFIPSVVKILEFDRENWKIKCRGWGESFDIQNKHPQGTEVKAITYSNMQIHEKSESEEKDKKVELFVIIDI